MCNGNELMLELIVSYHSSVLLILKSDEDPREVNERFGVEARRKLISNPVIKFSDFVDVDQNCSSDEEADEATPVCTVGKAVASTEVIRRHFCSYKTVTGPTIWAALPVPSSL
jgi:hypothetical protein